MSKLLINKVWFVAFVGAMLVVFAGCEAAKPADEVESGAKKVATYEGGEITQGELDEQLKLFAQQSGAGEIPKDSPQYDAAIQQIMPQLVSVEMATAYAEENGIEVSDKEVDKELDTIKEQVAQQAQASGQDLGKEEAFKQALEQAGISEDDLRNDIREQLPLQKVQARVTGDGKPSEKEIQAYYDENKEAQFTNPEQRCVRHILFNKDQEQKAEDVKAELEDGGDFAKLAKENSQDPGSAENGGDLGCQGEGAYVPNFEKAVFGAEEGELLGPVETEFGYHVIEVTDIKEQNITPLEEVSTQISDQLSQEQQVAEFEKWIQDQEKKRNLKYLPGYDPQQAQEQAPEGQEQPSQE